MTAQTRRRRIPANAVPIREHDERRCDDSCDYLWCQCGCHQPSEPSEGES